MYILNVYYDEFLERKDETYWKLTLELLIQGHGTTKKTKLAEMMTANYPQAEFYFGSICGFSRIE